MKRRSLVRNLVIVAGGLVLLPSCSGDTSKASIQLNNLDIDAGTEELLAQIVETLIPETDTPGARALNIHLFVLKMLDDCYEKDDQQKFLAGLSDLEILAKKQFGHSLIAC
ncbi:MAG: gluconate 2-dehydrogenase subunit 3 family protein, partial [Chitinophagaceae bacterium]|nr:gluconate 2-dehydrogenase subunit 3 family protein [Chitinophagaceae bacterium]